MATDGTAPASPDAPASKYWAFISYSHRDEAWAQWLHRGLESYRIPTALVGRASRHGPIPRRLFPVFRDREELPVSADLGGNLKAALEQSRYLIVICSPAAAISRWVEEEVRYFKALRGEDRLLCLIVAGEPNVADKPGEAAQECFPLAVRHRLDAAQQPTAEQTEPIAADVRPGKDGRARARLKIVAGIVGVNFDNLWHRERRRQVRRVALGVAQALLLTVVAFLAWQWADHRHTGLVLMAEGTLKIEEGRRLQAAPYFVAASRLGMRSPELEGRLREVAKALIEPIATLRESTNWVTCAVFLDEQTVLTGDWDRKLRRWDLGTGQASALPAEADKIAALAVSPDGGRFAVALWNGSAEVRARDGKLIASFAHGNRRVNAVAFDPTGTRLLTACDDGVARIWAADGSQAEPLRALPAHEDLLKGAAFSPDGKLIATGSFDTTAKIWSAATGERLLSLVPHPAGVNALAFAPDGRHLATGSLDGSVLLWDLAAAEQSKLPPPRVVGKHHSRRVNSVVFSRDGSRLLTAGDDRAARIWEVSTGQLLLSYEGHQDIVLGAAFSPDGRHAVSVSKDQTAAYFETAPKAHTPEEIGLLSDRLAAPLPKTTNR